MINSEPCCGKTLHCGMREMNATNVINGFDQCQFRCLPVFDHLFFHCLMMLLLLGHKSMFPIGNIEEKKRVFIC